MSIESETDEKSRTDVSEQEKQVGILESIREYPKEIFWSCIFSLGLVMAGYDAQIISSFYALSSFNKHYGTPDSSGEYAISAAWQTALSMGTPIGQIIGTLGCAWPMEWYGRKKTYAATVMGCLCLIFMQFFAPNLKVLCAGEILAGILWGACVLIAPTYSSEISHTSIRAVLEATNNLAFVIGQFIANGVSDAMANRTDEYAYKIPFAVQWIWPFIILICIGFAPESPYWLVRHGKMDEAKKSLRKVSRKSEDDESIEKRLFLIKEIDALEQELKQTTSYRDIFIGTNAKRTEICCMVYCIQIFSGIPLCMNYSTFFFEQAGLSDDDSFSLSLGSTAIGFVFTCASWFIMAYVGRRTLYNWGLVATTVILFIISFLDISPVYSTNDGVRWAQASLILVWSAIWQASIGPVLYVLLGEIPSTKLRGKTIAFATAMQSVTALVFTIIMPYMLDTDEGNLRGKAGFIFAGISLVCIAWCFIRLPETKDRTFDEIDIMFHRGVHSRDFSKYVILDEAEDVLSTKDSKHIIGTEIMKTEA
ncbi:hypothetical protein PACTADRAFT_76152 [Pachysolen tannophilus NRRL Y-2460]|uniref:Major facilitator superfamily (MFS) profile domain-containing protein n=1 Tax=Pachysolen tannophilus NRRL Y-2460 TaxID=669874 RepID=A0A1E4TVN3_PACTA|nr:hypothetical protein PACTADRAFT_76152 [Pachysolen tannophilus NRRL Y-2460]